MSGRSVTIDDDEFDDDLYDDDSFEEEEELEEEEEEESDDDDDGTETSRPAQQNELTHDRFAGMQSALQQSQEANRALQGRLLIMAAEQRRQQLVASGVDDAQAQMLVRSEVQQALLDMAGNNINTERQANEESARILRARELAIDNSIALDSAEFKRLMQFKDPDDMAEYAKAIAGRSTSGSKKSSAKTGRKKPSAKFKEARPVGRPKRTKAKSLSEAADRFISRRI